jgi:hypothetical protein
LNISKDIFFTEELERILYLVFLALRNRQRAQKNHAPSRPERAA